MPSRSRPSRADWLDRREKLADQFTATFGVDSGTAITQAHTALEGLIGPCPSPEPPEWSRDCGSGELRVALAGINMVDLTHRIQDSAYRVHLSAEEAEAVGHALLNAAHWHMEKGVRYAIPMPETPSPGERQT